MKGHTYCSACKATFPNSWFLTKDAIRKDSREFCSQKCADNYVPGHTDTWLSAIAEGYQDKNGFHFGKQGRR